MKTVEVHNKKYNIVYVYEYQNYWDKEKKQSRSKRTLLGRLDPITKEIVPTDGRMIKARERKAENLPADKSVVGSMNYSRKYYGASYLLEAISEKLGVTRYLKQYFPTTYKQILSIAFYFILGRSRALCNFDQFNAHTKHPHNRDISSQRSSDLFMKISQDSVYQFIKQLKQYHSENEYWAYDTTSISSYSKELKQVKYGHNKEGDGLAQINFALVFGENSNLPFYYKKMAGNTPDSKTVKSLLADFVDYGFKKLKLVMDKGNFSIENINALIENGHDFIIPPKMQMKFVQKEIIEVYDNLASFANYNIYQNVYSTTVPHEWHYQVSSRNKKDTLKKSKTLYMHFYFNPAQREKDEKLFNRKLYELQQELISGSRKKEHEHAYDKYFIISENVVNPKDEEIKKSKKYFGYMVLLSSERIDSITALEIYRNKDVIEKAMGTVKEKQGFRRPLVSNEKSLEGKLFVEYIALILLSYIKKQMQIKKLNKNYTMEKIFSTLDTIECFENKSNKIRFSEILEKQIKLYLDLGINIPT